MNTKPYWIIPFLFICITLSLAIMPVIAGPKGAAVSQDKMRDGGGAIKVMTMNVYVGADVDRLLEATDPSQIPLLVKQTYDELLMTDFVERAETIAKQIARERPHLIGLQEISLIRVQSPGDFLLEQTTPNANTTVFNYLEILQTALARHHLNYEVAGMVQNADVELPMIVDISNPTDPNAYDDVRLTDYDVILARHDVHISDMNKVEKNYADNLIVPGLGIPILRGYIAVDATINKRTYRFVNTHLEPAVPGLRELQASELIDALADEDKPVIVVGDFNTFSAQPAPSDLFVDNGYIDVWTRNLKGNEGEGFTFGHDPLLDNENITLDERLDHIFARNEPWGRSLLGPVIATVWGDALHDRTPSGLWPSDHAAVIAHIRIPVFSSVAYSE